MASTVSEVVNLPCEPFIRFWHSCATTHFKVSTESLHWIEITVTMYLPSIKFYKLLTLGKAFVGFEFYFGMVTYTGNLTASCTLFGLGHAPFKIFPTSSSGTGIFILIWHAVGVILGTVATAKFLCLMVATTICESVIAGVNLSTKVRFKNNIVLSKKVNLYDMCSFFWGVCSNQGVSLTRK